MDPRPRVVRQQGPVPVIQGHVALVHAVDGADESGDDYKDPDHREDPEEDDHGDGEAEAGPRGLGARFFSAVSRSLCLVGHWVTWMLSMMETRISPYHKMEDRKA